MLVFPNTNFSFRLFLFCANFVRNFVFRIRTSIAVPPFWRSRIILLRNDRYFHAFTAISSYIKNDVTGSLPKGSCIFFLSTIVVVIYLVLTVARYTHIINIPIFLILTLKNVGPFFPPLKSSTLQSLTRIR